MVPAPRCAWSGPLPASLSRGPGAQIPLASLFAGKQRLVIGRAGDCDVCLPHPMVSRYHALFEKHDSELASARPGQRQWRLGRPGGGSASPWSCARANGSASVRSCLRCARASCIPWTAARACVWKRRPWKRSCRRRRPDAQAAGQHQPGHQPGRVRQPAGAERLGQEHADGLPQRPASGHRRQGAGQRRGLLSPFRQLPPVARLRSAKGHRPHPADRVPRPATTPPGCACRPTPTADGIARADRGGHQRNGAGRRTGRPGRQPQRRPDQARQPGGRAAGPAVPAVHRRGDERPGRRHRGAA